MSNEALAGTRAGLALRVAAVESTVSRLAMDLPNPVRFARWASLVLALTALAMNIAGCAPAVGDRCQVSTDCSATGSLQCDTSQPDGYCTVFDCAPNKCPGNSACAEVRASVLGCAYNDRQAPSREGRNYCLKTCKTDSDCRIVDGFACVDVSQSFTTVVVDDNPASHLCMVVQYAYSGGGGEDAAICGTNVPAIDAGDDADDGSAGDGDLDGESLEAAVDALISD